MKPEKFQGGSDLYIERHRRREGPPIVYVVRKGFSCVGFTNTKDALRWIKWPKGTPTGDELRAWFDSFKEADAAATNTKLDKTKVKAEGFGPEAHDDEIDPTANTKMVT